MQIKNSDKLTMETSYYDVVELEDMSYDERRKLYHYPCPCGDRFELRAQDIQEHACIAYCGSCSLAIRVITNLV